MQPKTIAVIAALDMKGVEAAFIRQILVQRGHQALVIDIGILSDPQTPADVASRQVAESAGADLDALRTEQNKAKAMDVMTRGSARIAAALYAERKIDGIIGIGGSAGTIIGSSAMRALPVGFPKVLVSTVAAGDTRPYVGTKDISMMYSVVDISGINRISSRVLANGAGAIIGMVETEVPQHQERPLIAASMFGNTTKCVDCARAILDAGGFEVLVFHATGSGGQTMEGLISDGHIDGVLDLTTTEWADELCGGVFSAGPNRLDAAARCGISQVIAPGCLDMVNFGSYDTVPARYAKRKLYRWNPNVTLMRTNVDENRRLGKILAEKVNQCVGPVTVLLPLGGLSQLDSEGGEFWWPDADGALFDAIRSGLRADIACIELPVNINDPVFASRAANVLLDSIDRRLTSRAIREDA